MKSMLLIVAMMTGFVVRAQALDVDMGIQKTMDGFSAAWGKHDAKEMALYWAQDGDLINPLGRAASGRAEIEKLFAEEQGVPFKNSTISFAFDKSRTLAEGLALVDGSCAIKDATGKDGAAYDVTYHVTLILKKNGDDWQILSARPYAFVK